MAGQVRVLTLEDGEDYERKLCRIQKGGTVRFSLGTSLWYRNVELFSNYPTNENDEFDRKTFHLYEWLHSDKSNDFTCSNICFKRAGSYQFYVVTYDNEAAKQAGQRRICCSGSILVDPTLRANASTELPLDSVVMQTVLCKLLGPFPKWKKQLAIGPESGYNMFHFSPLQELGESNSSYSIRDHHNLNPNFSTDEQIFDLEKLGNFVEKVQQSWGMLSIVDVVWNHAANDSTWLHQHPQAGYNLLNSPHMRPAFLVDRALWYLNKDIMKGNCKDRGVPPLISEVRQLQCLSQLIRESINQVQLSEFFVVDVQACVDQFLNMFKASGFPEKKRPINAELDLNDLKVIQDEKWTRFGCTVDFKSAVKSCFKLWDSTLSREENMGALTKRFRVTLKKLNEEREDFVNGIVHKIVDSTIGHTRYHFIDSAGPKHGEVTELHSIAVRYFHYPYSDSSFKEDNELLEDPVRSVSIMAHNGWVMGFDATKNFAEADCMVYLTRELFAWGDSIKLNYGKGPDDCPFLYSYMKTYTEAMARIFHGFRIDNCHSTPIHVAEYLLDCARQISPDLYVVAELFTNNEATDNIFINRLGINSLIRENMGAGSSRDLGGHVHRYGGDAVGSFIHPPVRPFTPHAMAHALLVDLTHDNRSLFEARSVFDVLPSSAMVCMTSCGVGSTRGFDELVPHHIDVVQEQRLYKTYSSTAASANDVVTKSDGILACKEALNILHVALNEDGFSQLYVDQMTEEVCSVTRHNPDTHESIIMVCHNAFQKPHPSAYPSLSNINKVKTHLPPLFIQGSAEKVIMESRLLEVDDDFVFQKDEDFINGNSNYQLDMRNNIDLNESKFCRLTSDGNAIEFTNFVPGSIIVIKVSLRPEMKTAFQYLRSVLSSFPSFGHHYDTTDSDSSTLVAPFSEVIGEMGLEELNRILYRCGAEEQKEGWGGGAYNVPGHGDLVYCGLQGIMSVLSSIRSSNDLGHPLCENLRQGNWLMDYTCNRLKVDANTKAVGHWLETVFARVKVLPRYLVPCYFDAIVTCVYASCLDRTFALMSRVVQQGTSLFKHLSLVSVQLIGRGDNSLPAVVSPSGDLQHTNTSMAAGLPHFSTGYMRCWGRDTFISMRGLFLITGRFQLARHIILSFAGVVRHGLVPNLLSDGVHSRYNSRDATWFWLQSIQEYCNMSHEGSALLSAPVVRMYPTSDSIAVLQNAPRMELQDVIQEILMTHFQGVSFRERNGGVDLDRDMSEEGFHQSIGVDLSTGFVLGGNLHNCGTWMDKMGSSDRSQNKGHPSTPRDGSAVEIVGLCKSTLRWLQEMNKVGAYRYTAVTRKDESDQTMVWTYQEWEKKIATNFERMFYVSEECNEDMVHKRVIYKDTVNSHARFTDFQLRPNFPIAMCVAPEMFHPKHALAALLNIEKYLVGPLGLKTLDPDDQRYDGNYENSLDNDDFYKAKGFNYHQGPEWVWVLGPYLRAMILFSDMVLDRSEFLELLKDTKRMLLSHYRHLMSSPWRGVTELTNKDGDVCGDSCPTQAWSSACLLEVLVYIDDCQMKKVNETHDQNAPQAVVTDEFQTEEIPQSADGQGEE